ncbi:MAG: sugar nucleotide-binding protein, partial [Planctomycetes bacterium]|nr:sugar nucleotide-binding protein [Planctomycetota bacterium]
GSILITGAGGVLGLGLAQAAPAGAGLGLAGRRRPGFWPASARFHPVDLAVPGQLADLVGALRPAVVLHAAAVTRVGAAEADPALCRRVNVEAVVELVAAAAGVGARVLLVSTDMVFAGDRESYQEQDLPDAASVYGRSKADAEARVLAAGHAVARLPLLLGGRAGPGRCGADTALLSALAAGERPVLYGDEWRAPIAAELAAEVLFDLLGRLATSELEAGGVFHIGGCEPVDRHRLGLRVCSAAKAPPAFDFALAAELAPERPRRLILRCDRARWELGWRAPDLRQSLARRFPTAP